MDPATIDTSNIPTDSKQLMFTAVIWILAAIATFFVAVKLTSTVIIFRRPGWDDLVILLSMVSSIITTAFIQASIHYGLGRHTSAVLAEPDGLDNIIKLNRMKIIGYSFNVVAYTLPSVAILILIERLLGKTTNTARMFLRAVVAIQLVLGVMAIILMFVQCRPIKKLWLRDTPGTCFDQKVFNYSFYVHACYTTFAAFVLAVVPIRAFWKLQMKRQEKVEVTLLLGFTFTGAIFSVVKACYLTKFYNRLDPNPLYNIVTLLIWGLVEQNVVIMAACVPTIRPLIRLIQDKHPIRSAVGYLKGSTDCSNDGADSKHNSSVSEMPLHGVHYHESRASQPSLKAQSSTEEWHGKGVVALYE
ncbi:hypothetical protein F66182_6095 [Fusarium sp. NRRL 66182]|nr:hypothetical protein F66182_6095 [Fusarium sp. NRRL 66182]